MSSWKIETIKRTRSQAVEAMAKAVDGVARSEATELELRDAVHRNLRLHDELREEGWYVPPPHGLMAAIGNPPTYEHAGQSTYRPESTWPSTTRFLSEESILLLYASPVDRASGLIGDVGCSLYRGEDNGIRDHLARVWEVSLAIAELSEVGMSFADLYAAASRLIAEHGFENNIYSVHDGNDTNIGHTIPWSDDEPTQREQETLRAGSDEEVADLISGKRRFLSGTETMKITGDMAFTVEPRLNGPDLPTSWFHLIVAFSGSRREVITGFEPLFTAFGMDASTLSLP